MSKVLFSFQRRGKLRHWEVISLAQAHIVQKWQSQISNETMTDRRVIERSFSGELDNRRNP